MSTLTIKVCEECGKQTCNWDTWLVIKGLDVRSSKTQESLVHTYSEVDLCGPGCLLRYISRSMKSVVPNKIPMNKHLEEPDEQPREHIMVA